jgi:hypothetical protein
MEGPFREGQEVDPFISGGFRAQDLRGNLSSRRVRHTVGTITRPDGTKVRGFIRITDSVGPDGKMRETSRAFKAFNKQQGDPQKGEQPYEISPDVAREYIRLNAADAFGLSTFSKRYTDQEQKDIDTAKKAAMEFGGMAAENAMERGQQGEAGHFAVVPDMSKDLRTNRSQPLDSAEGSEIPDPEPYKYLTDDLDSPGTYKFDYVRAHE